MLKFQARFFINIELTMKVKSFINIFTLASILLSCNAFADANQYLNSVRQDPNKLYKFLKDMPKGGELHYHFTGSSYPQELIKISQKNSFYIDAKTFNVNNNNSLNLISTQKFFQDLKNQHNTINAWSMQNLTNNYKERHDHFFDVFMKVNPIYKTHYDELLASQLNHAANQNAMYMEIALLYLENPEKYNKIIKNKSSLKSKQQALLNNKEFQSDLSALIAKGDRHLIDSYKYLGCDKDATPKTCQVVARLQTYVLRETSMDDFFPAALAAFIAAQESRNIVAVNIVQPENGKLALQNFNKQMQVFNFLHQQYPKVNIVMHAGELDPKTTSKQYLSNHIHQSIYIGKAQRIGHGTDIRYENAKQTTLEYMASHNIPVEINLTSNELILAVKGESQPLKYYLQNNVPVVLSTDDQGILQTDLTKQYVAAAQTYNLDYATLKTINRNALTYSFMPGKSIWKNPKTGELTPECQHIKSQECRIFIKNNQKAFLQWILEDRLAKFENKYS